MEKVICGIIALKYMSSKSLDGKCRILLSILIWLQCDLHISCTWSLQSNLLSNYYWHPGGIGVFKYSVSKLNRKYGPPTNTPLQDHHFRFACMKSQLLWIAPATNLCEQYICVAKKEFKVRGGSRIFLRRGALVFCSTSKPISHIIFFAEYQLY